MRVVFFQFIFLSLFSFEIKAQNLIPNPSFEDTISCPTNSSQLNKAKYWINPTQSTPDCFNVCSTNNFDAAHVPDNGFGFQYAHTGNGYAGFYTGGPSVGIANGREYVQTALTSTLTAGKLYLVSFYLSHANYSKYATSKIGAYISVVAPTRNDQLVINFTPQIQNNQGFITDTVNWVQISGVFTAMGGEQYITIGNFNTDANTDTLNTGIGFSAHYYYIDDVSVIDSTTGISEISKENYIKVFPNPANNFLNIECELPDAEIKLFNVLGNEIRKMRLEKEAQIKVSDLCDGIYFIQISTLNGILSKKVIIQH